MKVKIKRLHPNSKIPQYAKDGDAGMDLTAVSMNIDSYGNKVYGTGIAIEIPKGYVGLLFPRSSNSNTFQCLTNSVGVIDSGYRGEIMFKYASRMINPNPLGFIWNRYILRRRNLVVTTEISHQASLNYKVGDRIGQLIIIPYPQIEFEEVSELSATDRGMGGYGSTGR